MPATETVQYASQPMEFYVIQPTDAFDVASYPSTIRVLEPMGDLTFRFSTNGQLATKKVLPPSRELEFDSLRDYRLIRNTTRRGKRRNHMLTLAAKALKREIRLPVTMLNMQECKRFERELTLLSAVIQGV